MVQSFFSSLKEMGFKQSAYDLCLTFKPGFLLNLCVDDAGVASPCDEDLDALSKRCTLVDFVLQREASFSE